MTNDDLISAPDLLRAPSEQVEPDPPSFYVPPSGNIFEPVSYVSEPTSIRQIGLPATPDEVYQSHLQQGEFSFSQQLESFNQLENTAESLYLKYKDAPIAANDQDIVALDNGWNALDAMKNKGITDTDLLFQFGDAEYPSELEWRLNNWKRETTNRYIVERMTIGESLGAGFITAARDPLSWAMAAIPFVKAGFVGRAAYGAGIGATEAAVAEVLLHSSQTERTLEESFLGIGATAIFGGILGPLAGKQAKDAGMERELERAYENLETDMTTGRGFTGDGPLSADKTYRYDPDVDLKFQNDIRDAVSAGKMTAEAGHKAIADEAARNSQVKFGAVMRPLRQISPLLYVSLSRSHVARSSLEMMTDSALIKNKHFQGIKSKTSMDTQIDTINSRMMVLNYNSIMDNYLEYLGVDPTVSTFRETRARWNSRGGKMSMEEFKKAVTDGYETDNFPNEFVKKAVEDREKIMGAYEKELVGTGVLRPDNHKEIKKWNEKYEAALKQSEEAVAELEVQAEIANKIKGNTQRLEEEMRWVNFELEKVRAKLHRSKSANMQKKHNARMDKLSERIVDINKRKELLNKQHKAMTPSQLGKLKARDTRARKILEELGEGPPEPSFKATLPFGAKRYLPRIFMAVNVSRYKPQFIEAVVKDWVDQAKLHLSEASGTADKVRLQARVDEMTSVEGQKILRDKASDIADNITRKAVPHLNIEFIGKTNVRKKHRNLRVRSEALRNISTPDGKTIDFIEKDIMAITRGHVTAMTPELVMKKNGFNMQDVVDGIYDDYAKILEELRAKHGKELEDGTVTLSKKGQREIRKVEREMNGVVDRMQALYQQLNNDYARPNNPTGAFNQLRLSVMQYNVMRMLGSMTISAVTDLGNFITHIGLGGMRGSFQALGNMWNKDNRQYARKMGLITETVLASRLNALTLSDEFGPNMSSATKKMHNWSKTFSNATGMNHWNAGLKEIALMAYQDELLGIGKQMAMAYSRVSKIDKNGKWLDADGNIIKKPVSDKRMAKFAVAGIDVNDFIAIGNKHIIDLENNRGNLNGLRVSDFDADHWTDEAGQNFLDVLKRQSDMAIVTPGAGDLPLWIRTPVGSMIGQFKSFSFTAINRIMLPNMQRIAMGDPSAVVGMTMQMGLAVAVYNAKMWGMDKEPDNSWQNLSGEMFRRSGYFGILADIDAISHKVSRGNVSINALVGGGDVSRYYSRSFSGDLVGPTFGTLEDAGRAFGTLFSEDFNKGDLSSLRRLIPYQNLYWIRRGLTEGEQMIAQNMGL
jgi:hypothetical protein